MTWASGNHPASTPIRSTLAGPLAAAGLTRVTQDYASEAGVTLDVWKSAAADNSAGIDWYLIVGDLLSAGQRTALFSVCEGWDDATKTATKYIPATNNVAPAADFSVGAGAVAPTQANIFYMTSPWGGGWLDTSGTTYKVSATPDRVITSFGSGVLSTCYSGIGERIHDQTLDPAMPLLCVSIDGNTTYTSGVLNPWRGGTTREPGQTTAHAANFRCYTINSTSDNLYSLTQDQLAAKVILQPLVAKTSRTGYARCVLKDVRGGIVANGTASDVATETLPDGVTTVSYVNFQWSSTVQRFVPQV